MVFAKTRETFWKEHEQFRSQQGSYSSTFIWCSQELDDHNDFMWHKINSYKSTKVFGAVACIVCSKILGIGNAERNWGAVKKLKKERSTMSAQKLKMQATLYTAARIEEARKTQDKKEGRNDLWTNEDEAFELGLVQQQGEEQVVFVPQRLVYCFLEDWEKELRNKKDGMHARQKFETKYKGVMFKDTPHETFICIGMVFLVGRGLG